MPIKLSSTQPKPVLQSNSTEKKEVTPKLQQELVRSKATGYSSANTFSQTLQQKFSLDGAPRADLSAGTNTQVSAPLGTFSAASLQLGGMAGVFRAGAGGGGGRNPYGTEDEFDYTLHSAFARYGSEGAAALQAVINQVKAGQSPTVSHGIPNPGDAMIWGPNAGLGEDSQIGQANHEGHAAVVQSVTDNGDGTVTVRVTEQEWATQHGELDGVPYRDIVLEMENGQLVLPPNVGFVHVNPAAPVPAVLNPPIGPNETIDRDTFQIYQTPAHNPDKSWSDPSGINVYNDYRECLGYIHDMPAYGPFIEGLVGNNQNFRAGDIPTNSSVPEAGSLMVWDAPIPGGDPVGDDTVGETWSSMGHVAYVEEVTKNYDPPGDATGRVVSYTVTLSEANAQGNGSDDRSLRTFTVSANEDGTAALPGGVGFYDPNGTGVTSTGGTVATVPTVSSSSNPPVRGQVYTVQSGDTLSSIAQRAGVTVADILNHPNNANKVPNPDFISLDLQLYIP